MYTFLGKKKIIWLIISGLVFIPGLLSLIFWGLPLGIDFKGGGAAIWSFDQEVSEQEIRDHLSEQGILSGFSVSRTDGDNTFIVRFLPITEIEYRESLSLIDAEFNGVTEEKFENIGSSVSQDLTRKAIIAVILASVFILLYLAYAFKDVGHPVSSWRFGSVTLIALIHDVVISVGIFSILAHFFNYEVDAAMIAALLTIMSFSVHDTIVIFDRIRENVKGKGIDNEEEFEKVTDSALIQTLNRSLATSLTLILVLLALLLLGGGSIKAFIVMMMVGAIVGTYSSIFIAAPVLVMWQNAVFRKARLKAESAQE